MAGKTVERAFGYRFDPADAQAAGPERAFGCVRPTDGRAPAERTRRGGRRRVSWPARGKKDPGPGLPAEASSVPLRQSLRHLHTAFRNFFDERARYPRFGCHGGRRASAESTRSGLAYRADGLTPAKKPHPSAVSAARRWGCFAPLVNCRQNTQRTP